MMCSYHFTFHFFLFIALVTICISCTGEAATSKEYPSVKEKSQERPGLPKPSPESALLLFLAENQLEWWENGAMKAVYKLNLPAALPVGQFNLQSVSNEAFLLDFPDPYYAAKARAGNELPPLPVGIRTENFENRADFSDLAAHISASTRIIVFPNDARLTGEFAPCFACPHWMAEQYSYLSVVLKKYSN